MNLHYSLLKAFLNRDLYLKYKDYVNYEFLKENYPEISKLFKCLPSLHQSESDNGNEGQSIRDLSSLELELFTLYPQTSVQDYKPIFDQLKDLQIENEQVARFCQGLKERAYASRLAQLSLGVAEGTKPFSDLQTLLSESEGEVALETEDEEFVTDNLGVLLESQITKPGLRWPIDSLNRNLGSLRKGDFGFVFARPETGKTTFLVTVVPFMAGQTDRPVLWFNNEEQGDKVVLRLYQSVLGLSLAQLLSDIPKHQLAFYEATKRNIKFVNDASITKQRVEYLCKKYQPSLIIYDQIDKIQGFHKEERNDLDLKTIYVWARELSKQYAPTIAICQAGASGENKRWLTMGDVDNSKTGKQGEADFILGIGKVQDEGLESIRYFHLSKNKLIGDTDSDPSQRHGRWEVRIKPEIGRYEDF